MYVVATLLGIGSLKYLSGYRHRNAKPRGNTNISNIGLVITQNLKICLKVGAQWLSFFLFKDDTCLQLLSLA